MNDPYRVPVEPTDGDRISLKADLFNDVLGTPSWHARAICREAPPNMFFPSNAEKAQEAQVACLGCPVRGDCREFAERTRQRYGVWGGKFYG